MLRFPAFGDLAQTFQRTAQMGQMKTAINRSTTETTTGLVHRTATHLTARNDSLVALEASLQRLDAYAQARGAVNLRIDAVQSALEAIDDMSSALSVDLMNATASAHAVTVDTLARDSATRFEATVGLLNGRLAERALFAGRAEAGPALRPAQQILDELQTVVAGAVSAADVETLAGAWFDDPAGFAAFAYLGGDAAPGIPVSDTDNVAVPVTAADPALRDTLKGLAMAALLDRGALAGLDAQRKDLAARAGQVLFAAGSDRTMLAASLGVVADRLDRIGTQGAAQRSGLEIARVGLIGVDPFASATRLQEAQRQLESVFAITARMSRLNLMDFLR
ncbi:flagellar biosynthesis protein FlgL [Aliigemmobacter aestuarii]|uniref:Flagellar biosynthesis protein FlgL n=2 Tax=Aliigemmobacter aestuarii TaxID=1445661 RepID=A0A4S3MUM2_9RHOB|nr:flagellar biosynthesis protein FlgL [Gemmobacter aestuarii]